MPSNLVELATGSVVAAPSYHEFRARLAASDCSLCPELCTGRTHIVIDRGNPESKLVLIGEAPGENEDLTGQAFVGRAGQLLDRIMAAIDIETNRDTLIINVVKCRPPKNRAPKPQEAIHCRPYLLRQLELVKPTIVVLLGATAAKYFLPKTAGSTMRDQVGKFFDVKEFPGVKFLLLYHPAYLLRDPRKKTDMEKHVKGLRRALDAEALLPAGRKR